MRLLGTRLRGRDLIRFSGALRAGLVVVATMNAAWASDTLGGEINVVASDMAVQQPSANWLSYNGDYSGRRYSALAQITTINVNRLQAEWVFHSRNSDRMEVTPVVVDGLMLVTSANDTFALDAQTGRTVWHHSRPISEGLNDDASRHLSRGVGIWHNRVYRLTDNAHLLCLDVRSGNL